MRSFIRTLDRLFIALALLLSAAILPSAAAQTPSAALASLAVELWPDYDRPAVLVLLTGALPASAPLPATVTIPVPPDADINAVARFNEAGALLSDVDYTVENGLLTMTVPSDRFRVEYYAPYQVDGTTYSYPFDWTADLDIDQMTVVVQQPLAATDITISPTPSGTADRGDGLTYHTLAARPVGAGEPVSVDVAYTVEAPVLSAPSQTLPAETQATAPAATGTSAGDGFNPWWLAAIAGALVLIGGAWYMGQRQGRSASRARKPQPARPAKPKPAAKATPADKGNAAKFCHNCGQPARAADVFCRHCGTPLKK